MTELERIKIAVKALISLGVSTSQEGIGQLMGYTNKSSFSQVLNGKVSLPKNFVDKLCSLDKRLVKMWITNEMGDVLRSKEKSKQVYINNKLEQVNTPVDYSAVLIEKEIIISELRMIKRYQEKEIKELQNIIKNLKKREKIC